MKGHKLSPKQEKFCREYVKDLNGKQAAIRAGYSPKTADVQASKMLNLVKVNDRVTELKQKAAERNELTTDRILEELMYIAFGRITDVADFDDAGVKFKSSDEIPDGVARAISEISSKSSTKDGITFAEMKLKMYDKQRALSLLMDYTGMKKAPDNADNIDRAAANIDKLTQDQLKALDDIQGTLGGA